MMAQKRVQKLEEIALDNIAAYLMDRSRLSFAGHKRGILRRRLESRLIELQLPDFTAYWSYLNRSGDEDTSLFNLATTNETSFFRNPAQFDYLHDRIIPGFERSFASEKNSLRVLCAGCSTGEEPYSVAMTLLNALNIQDSWRVEIVAGDLSESCLQVARTGYYELEKLSKLPSGYREKFMTSDTCGAKVKDQLKSIVRFTRLNLDDLMKSDCPSWNQGLGVFDIIFCRNVMIYFAPSCQQLLVDTLHRLLVPGGYLFTGDAEPLHLFRHEFQPVNEAGCLIYQKYGDISQ
jgi:chemotaxis protein methyltransferase CheR